MQESLRNLLKHIQICKFEGEKVSKKIVTRSANKDANKQKKM